MIIGFSRRGPDEAIDEIVVNKVKVFLVKVAIAILLVIAIIIGKHGSQLYKQHHEKALWTYGDKH